MRVICELEDCKNISKRSTKITTKSGDTLLVHTCRRKNVIIVPATMGDSMFTEKYIARCICYEPEGDENNADN